MLVTVISAICNAACVNIPMMLTNFIQLAHVVPGRSLRNTILPLLLATHFIEPGDETVLLLTSSGLIDIGNYSHLQLSCKAVKGMRVQRAAALCRGVGCPHLSFFPGWGGEGYTLPKAPLKLLNVLQHWLYKYVMLNKENIIWLYGIITLL
jgi:hypothetical protein